MGARRGRWKGHHVVVYEHHSHEDNLFNPALEERFKIPDKFAEAHSTLEKKLKDLDTIITAFAPGKEQTADELYTCWVECTSFELCAEESCDMCHRVPLISLRPFPHLSLARRRGYDGTASARGGGHLPPHDDALLRAQDLSSPRPGECIL